MRNRVCSVLAVLFLFALAYGAPVRSAPFADVAPHRESGQAITKIHGFHCRPEYGWDARVGGYRRHTHPGICRDYQGCMKQQQRCIFVNGRGWDVWKYERWGFENWRYTNCMIRAGCY